MDRAALGDIELQYELHGVGAPVLLIHPGIFADWFVPFFHEPALTNRYRLVHYHRAGCAGSSRIAGPVTLSRHARDARSLLQRLGITRAHVVGHSSSGNIAFVLSDATYLLQVMNPRGMAEGLATFLARHLLGAASAA